MPGDLSSPILASSSEVAKEAVNQASPVPDLPVDEKNDLQNDGLLTESTPISKELALDLPKLNDLSVATITSAESLDQTFPKQTQEQFNSAVLRLQIPTVCKVC